MTQLMVNCHNANDYAVHFYREGHWYVFQCNSETRRECLRLVGLAAADPELNLTWDDAAIITSTIRLHVPLTPNQEQRLPGVGASTESGQESAGWFLLWQRALLGCYLVASIVFWACVAVGVWSFL